MYNQSLTDVVSPKPAETEDKLQLLQPSCRQILPPSHQPITRPLHHSTRPSNHSLLSHIKCMLPRHRPTVVGSNSKQVAESTVIVRPPLPSLESNLPSLDQPVQQTLNGLCFHSYLDSLVSLNSPHGRSVNYHPTLPVQPRVMMRRS